MKRLLFLFSLWQNSSFEIPENCMEELGKIQVLMKSKFYKAASSTKQLLLSDDSVFLR